ncbi:large conductance mechanosensitive channel protein MscL [Anaerosoma tenue]|uniref:large conductance mechanosensitive channel protein MscL n=1 Tax=Anaerosoma tenue TaxID=2933588 RepID=UPI002260ABCF|nr:large conductance mechanosensitive channel protein MscL [Anaerosoma tenue]MCK8115299.1 large conductance mechanosensitive channel protein MscL [Anaerosoma tenue]
MLKEFKEFAIKGNMVDLAIGVIIGGAFGAVVSSLVNDLVMPLVGALLGGTDFTNMFWVVTEGATPGPYATLAAATEAGAATLNYGVFINTVINFLIIAWAIFFVVKAMNNMRKKEEAEEAVTTKECPYCKSQIALDATRCPSCTSEL